MRTSAEPAYGGATSIRRVLGLHFLAADLRDRVQHGGTPGSPVSPLLAIGGEDAKRLRSRHMAVQLQSVEYLGCTFSPRICAIALLAATAASAIPIVISVIFPG